VESAVPQPGPLESLLYDPQTSGGLLITLPEADARALVESFESAYRIGRVMPRAEKAIRLVNSAG
jgi:selenide,water dikinase